MAWPRFQSLVGPLLSTCLIAACGEQPVSFTDKQGCFSIRQGSGLRLSVADRVIGTGTVDVRSWCDTAGPSLVASLWRWVMRIPHSSCVSYFDLAELPESGARGVTNELRDADVTSMKVATASEAALKRDADIALEGHVGREYRIENAKGTTAWVRVYIVGKRVYRIAVVGPCDQVYGSEGEAFLSSFRILDR